MKKYGVFAAVLVVAMVFSVVASAVADPATYPGSGSPLKATGTVTVKANVKPKLTLTVVTPEAGQTVDFGDVDPEATASKTVNMTVNSNKSFTLSSAQDAADEATALGLTRSFSSSTGAKGANRAFSDTYGINIPWDTNPGEHTVSVTYTAVQD